MSEPLVTAPGQTPEAFIHAELASFPFVAEEAFRLGICALDPALSRDTPTQRLWRACELHLSKQCNWSLDRLVSARDHLWFEREQDGRPSQDQRVSMTSYLTHLARVHFEATPGLTRPIGPDGSSTLQAADRARWLSFAMPEDLLFGALGVEPAPERIEPDAPLLIRRLVDLGVAEIHQHLGASMEFPLLWVSALATLANTELDEHALRGPGAPFDEGRHMVRWLQSAAIARCVLAEHLARHGEGRGSPSLRAFLDNLLEAESPLSMTQRLVLLDTLRALEAGADAKLPKFLALRDLYAEVHPTAIELGGRPLTSVEDAYRRCDPVCLRMGLGGRNAGERWLQREALAYLAAHSAGEQRDRLFERLWWQVVRVRCHYYRAIVERPMNAGLQWFIRFYDRIGPLRRPLKPILVEASYKAAGVGERIAALEVRSSMRRSPIALAEEVLLPMLCSWQSVLREIGEQPVAPEFGVLLHFVKARDLWPSRAWRSGAPEPFWSRTHAQPQVLGSGGRARYLEFFNRQLDEARALVSLINKVPEVQWLVRGLDVASDELAAPGWLFVPLFEYLRLHSTIASRHPGGGPPLGATAHVGEDFRHLMEGMRRIYEQVHYLLGRRGGRLGHAVALGVNPQLWAEAAGQVSMPLEQRLWDLVFEWRLYTRYHVADDFAAEAPAGRIEHLENHIREFSKELALERREPLEPRLLADIHHTLHRFLLPKPGQPWRALEGGREVFARCCDRIHDPSIRKYLRAYLVDPDCFRRGQQVIDVPIDRQEVEALRAVQDGLRHGIARRSVVVEVNPSSNLLIGDLGDLRHHPILRLFPPERHEGDPPPIAIAVGSDDPVTFSTSLLHEYVLLHQAGRAAGYSERAVQLWLDAIRRTGMDARMTRQWHPTGMGRAKEIERGLMRFLKRPGHRRSEKLQCLLDVDH